MFEEKLKKAAANRHRKRLKPIEQAKKRNIPFGYQIHDYRLLPPPLMRESWIAFLTLAQ
jgi:hypothetical protein